MYLLSSRCLLHCPSPTLKLFGSETCYLRPEVVHCVGRHPPWKLPGNCSRGQSYLLGESTPALPSRIWHHELQSRAGTPVWNKEQVYISVTACYLQMSTVSKPTSVFIPKGPINRFLLFLVLSMILSLKIILSLSKKEGERPKLQPPT